MRTLARIVTGSGVALAAAAFSWAQADRPKLGPDGGPAFQRSETEAPSDRLEREVRTRLFGDPQLSEPGAIAVIVDGRRVLLEGWVGSVNERTLAEADAATVAGVSTVDNRLLVRGAPAP